MEPLMLRTILLSISIYAFATHAVLPAAEVIKAIPYDALVTAPGALTDRMAAAPVTIREGEALSDVEVVGGNSSVARVLVRLPAVTAVSGVMVVFPTDGKPVRVPFTIPQAVIAAAPDGTKAFATASAQRCQIWLNQRDDQPSGIIPTTVDPGSRAWWSQRYAEASAAGEGIAPRAPERDGGDRLDDTMDLFTGMTALGENLQFDRRLAITGDGAATVALSALPTLTTREVPWELMPSAKEPQPTLDALAAHIPADQHALLLPSFAALTATMDQGDALLAGPLHLIAGRGEDAGILRRYQHQLGLELTELSKRFGAQVIDAVAITGSDPFLRAGTDVAILLRAKQPALLAAYLELRRQALITAGAANAQGSTGGMAWRGAVTPDRSVSSYTLMDGDIAVVTNSLSQIEAYTAVRAKTRPALTTAPELTFFRRRYAMGADGEVALGVISDATIRRWCGARCRIGDSRRTRAALALSQLQAEWIAAGSPQTWTPPQVGADLGTITVGVQGVRSSLYGSLHFLTPIAELPLENATTSEAEAFRRFIQRYEQSWRAALDPIALRLSTRANGGLGIDLSVLPLIVRSDYLELLRWVGKAHISTGGDPHPSAVQIAVAMDRDGETFAEANRNAARMLAGLASPLGWIGDTASLYADEDPFWDEMTKMDARERNRVWQHRLSELPVGLNIAVREPLTLVACLAGLRTLAESSAPGMLMWETRTFAEIPYVRVSPTNEGRGMLGDVDAHLLYLATPEGLTLTLSQPVMERAITRLKARRAAKDAPVVTDPTWGGNQAALRVTPRAIELLNRLDEGGGANTWMHQRNSATIAILNEWHRLFPQEDSLAVHERLWGTRPVCVAGGTYRWNAEWLTMESSVLGFEYDDLKGPELPGGMEHLGLISAGLSFEDLPAAPLNVSALAPGERQVVAKAGDTWRSVAEAEGVRAEDVARRNGVRVEDPLTAGRQVIIPLWDSNRSRSVGLRVRLELQTAAAMPAPSPTIPVVP